MVGGLTNSDLWDLITVLVVNPTVEVREPQHHHTSSILNVLGMLVLVTSHVGFTVIASDYIGSNSAGDTEGILNRG